MIYEIDAIDALETFIMSSYFPKTEDGKDVDYSVDSDSSVYTVMCYISKEDLKFDSITDAIKKITDAFKKFVETEKYPEELITNFNVTDTTQTNEYVLEITDITFDERDIEDLDEVEDPDADYEYNEDELRMKGLDESNVVVTQVSALTKPEEGSIVDGVCTVCGENADENHACSKLISTNVEPTLENTFVTTLEQFKQLLKK